ARACEPGSNPIPARSETDRWRSSVSGPACDPRGRMESSGLPILDRAPAATSAPTRRRRRAGSPGARLMESPDRSEEASSEGRKAATQARILDAAAQLFITQGYERTSISGIATRARVSRAAVFWHFGTKAGLFEETVRRLLGPFVEEMRGNLTHLPPRKRIFELIELYESFVTNWRPPP